MKNISEIKFEGIQTRESIITALGWDFHNTESAARMVAEKFAEYVNENKAELRRAVANYMASEGCSCCRDIDGHKTHTEKLAELLDVPTYSDNSGYDFLQFKDGKV